MRLLSPRTGSRSALPGSGPRPATTASAPGGPSHHVCPTFPIARVIWYLNRAAAVLKANPGSGERRPLLRRFHVRNTLLPICLVRQNRLLTCRFSFIDNTELLVYTGSRCATGSLSFIPGEKV